MSAVVGHQHPVTRLLYHVLTVPLVLGALASGPRRWGLGPVSALAGLAIVQLCLFLLAFVLLERIPKRLPDLYLPYFGFLLVALASVSWAPPSTEGVQNGLVYVLFGLGIFVAASLAASDPRRAGACVARGMTAIFWITLAIVVLQLLWYGIPVSREAYTNSVWLVTPRAIAIVLLFPLGWHLSRWYYGNPRSAVMCLALIAGQAMTLSRMATATGVVLVAAMLVLQARFRPGRMVRNAPLLIGLVLTVIGLALYYEPLRHRMFSGDTSIEVGGVRVNASGRMVFWAIIIDSARERPMVGHGLGSAQELLDAQMNGDITHPHNDYLRVWHDLGAVGIALMVLSWACWFRALFRTWHRSERTRGPAASEALTAILVSAGVMIVMLTDNAIVYSFVMAPLGIVVGAGLGAGLAPRLLRVPPSRVDHPPVRPVAPGAAVRQCGPA